ncbi:MAG: Hsp70 family protein, partial [Sphingobacteriia bacterium]|nr:Hsp70 family protein [Sphingobacteriia bacterium]
MRTHIDYGLYFNDDFCQIARMEHGMPVIKLSDTLKESMPLCVHFNKRGDIFIGDAAFNVIKNDQVRALKSFEPVKTNSFNQFTRTLGTSHSYESSNTGKSYSSEELLGQCFRKLKSFVQDEDVKAAVITVPAKFTITQIEALKNAGRFAGFEQIELITEPIATSIGYGIRKGTILIIDFGYSSFNASLINYDTIIDTIDDYWLGSKNIVEAIVDQLIFPYLQETYAIDSILDNPT